MGMVIHDDFWEAARAMPEKQRAPFIYALCEYRMEGVLPKGRPAWLPTFIAIKDRLDMGDRRSEKARKAANARWKGASKDDADALTEQDAQACSEHMLGQCQSICDASDGHGHNVDAEVEYGDRGGDKPPYISPFATQCLNVFNEVMVTAFRTMPEACALHLERMSESYTLDDVRRMVEHKRDEWRGTRYSKALTPNTLFSRDHFEQYVHQSREEATGDDLEMYD